MTINTNWSFLPLAKGAKARDPMQDEFFQDQSIGGIEHALIRETVQNSLDARAGAEPVRIVFTLGELSSLQARYWFPENVQAHFSAKEIRLASLPDWDNEKCSFLAIEDFGTKGLEGETNTTDPKAGGNFYHFFRAEGLSNKGDGARGSWGVGKIVIPRTSRVRTFFAITSRAVDRQLHLMGQTILRHHTVEGTQYTPDGWLSEDDNGLQVPYTANEITQKLNIDFQLTRENEPGLGIVIPWIYDEHVTLERLASAIAREYFIPILAGNLIVELKDHRNGVCQRWDATCYDQLKTAALDDEQFQDTIELAGSLLNLNQKAPLSVQVVHESGQNCLDYNWLNYRTSLPPSEIELALDYGRVVHFRVPMTIKSAKGTALADNFDVLIKRKPGRHFPVYIREELIIPNLSSRKRTPDTVALIHTSGSVIADALRRAECPAHTDWKSSRDKFQERKYSAANKLIPFVRDSALRLLEKLSTDDGKPDNNMLASILPLPSNDPLPQTLPESGFTDQNKDSKDTAVKSNFGAPEIPTASARCWKLSQSSNEIRLSGNASGFNSSTGYKLSLRAAYDLRGRNPFKAHSPFDFNLIKAAAKGVDDTSNFKLTANEFVKIISGDYGSLEVHVSSPEFEIKFLPADLNRDLIMKVNSMALEETWENDEDQEEANA